MVDDGSRDQTAAIVNASTAKNPEVTHAPESRQSWRGLRSVPQRHSSLFRKIVMFADADLSAPIEEAEGLAAAIASGADIAIGSRYGSSARQTIRQPLYRQFFGRCFDAVTRAVMPGSAIR